MITIPPIEHWMEFSIAEAVRVVHIDSLPVVEAVRVKRYFNFHTGKQTMGAIITLFDGRTVMKYWEQITQNKVVSYIAIYVGNSQWEIATFSNLVHLEFDIAPYQYIRLILDTSEGSFFKKIWWPGYPEHPEYN